MNIPVLNGGLGNQLFQIAAAYACSLESGDSFAINYKMGQPGPNQGKSAAIYRNSLYSKIPTTEYIPDNIYREKKFGYTPIPTGTRNSRLIGYFQSERYFDEYKENIVQLFDIPNRKQKNRIAIHVRRGDYTWSPNFLPPTPIGYYRKAITAINDSRAEIVIYTDSHDLVKEEFKSISDNVQCSSNELDDFYSIAESKYVICANSSFSWWASWLGVNDLVTFPDPWFGPDGPQDYHDVYRKDSVILSC